MLTKPHLRNHEEQALLQAKAILERCTALSSAEFRMAAVLQRDISGWLSREAQKAELMMLNAAQHLDNRHRVEYQQLKPVPIRYGTNE